MAVSRQDDISLLQASEESAKRDHIWRVDFEVEVREPEPEAGEDATVWVFDSMDVAAGPDGQSAIDLLREHARNEPAFGIEVLAFRVIGLRLLAEAEL